ncbi:protein GOLM2 isoform X1 [Anabrus simplex]|uniref:protein GOLM2 isoform X1 n=1 Tax=Anabrus simplex TaxID=316456 RepID=UPI0034DDAAA7
MGLDSMRGSYYGRCPPFLVGALFLICLILTFNWWSSSAQNYDLIKQLNDLSEQLKISSEEQERCARQRSVFENQIKSSEEESAQLRVKLDQQRLDNEEYKKQLIAKDDEIKSALKSKDDCESSVTRCTTELESLKKLGISKDGVIASLRIEKERLNSDVAKHKHAAQKLEEKLKQVQTERVNTKQNANIVVDSPSPTKATDIKNSIGFNLENVEVDPVGLRGMIYHKEPILPQDPPNALRPKPRLSITYLHPEDVVRNQPLEPEYTPPEIENPEKDDDTAAERGDGGTNNNNDENNAAEKGDGEGNEDAQDETQGDYVQVAPDDETVVKKPSSDMNSPVNTQ